MLDPLVVMAEIDIARTFDKKELLANAVCFICARVTYL